MEQEVYHIKDLVKMSQLSDKSIRNYIKDGRLHGQKVDGVWTFTKEEIAAFFDDRFVKDSIQIKNNIIIQDFVEDTKKKAPSFCAVYDYPIQNENEAETFCNLVLNKVNAAIYGIKNMSFSCNASHRMLRIILVGDMKVITQLLSNL